MYIWEWTPECNLSCKKLKPTGSICYHILQRNIKGLKESPSTRNGENTKRVRQKKCTVPISAHNTERKRVILNLKNNGDPLKTATDTDWWSIKSDLWRFLWKMLHKSPDFISFCYWNWEKYQLWNQSYDKVAFFMSVRELWVFIFTLF